MKTQIALLDNFALMLNYKGKWIAKDLVLVRPDPRKYLQKNTIYDGHMNGKNVFVKKQKFIIK